MTAPGARLQIGAQLGQPFGRGLEVGRGLGPFLRAGFEFEADLFGDTFSLEKRHPQFGNRLGRITGEFVHQAPLLAQICRSYLLQLIDQPIG